MGVTKTSLCAECMDKQEWAGILDRLYELVEDAVDCAQCNED